MRGHNHFPFVSADPGHRAHDSVREGLDRRLVVQFRTHLRRGLLLAAAAKLVFQVVQADLRVALTCLDEGLVVENSVDCYLALE